MPHIRRAPMARARGFVSALMLSGVLAASADAAPSVIDPAALAVAHLTPAATVILHGSVFHVQGVDVDADFIYVTSVDKDGKRGYLHKFTRDGALVKMIELTDGARFHPGG